MTPEQIQQVIDGLNQAGQRAWVLGVEGTRIDGIANLVAWGIVLVVAWGITAALYRGLPPSDSKDYHVSREYRAQYSIVVSSTFVAAILTMLALLFGRESVVAVMLPEWALLKDLIGLVP